MFARLLDSHPLGTSAAPARCVSQICPAGINMGLGLADRTASSLPAESPVTLRVAQFPFWTRPLHNFHLAAPPSAFVPVGDCTVADTKPRKKKITPVWSCNPTKSIIPPTPFPTVPDIFLLSGILPYLGLVFQRRLFTLTSNDSVIQG